MAAATCFFVFATHSRPYTPPRTREREERGGRTCRVELECVLLGGAGGGGGVSVPHTATCGKSFVAWRLSGSLYGEGSAAGVLKRQTLSPIFVVVAGTEVPPWGINDGNSITPLACFSVVPRQAAPQPAASICQPPKRSLPLPPPRAALEGDEKREGIGCLRVEGVERCVRHGGRRCVPS